jgi:hypothetical protein
MDFISLKRIIIIISLAFGLFQSGYGQTDSIPDYVPQKKKAKPENDMRFIDRLFWGGNVGAWIGNPTFVDLSPLVGIRITDKFSCGVGVIYNYYNYTNANYKYTTHLYGSRIYGRYFIFDNVFAQVGWDRINRDDPYSYLPNTRVWVDNFLVGGGVRYAVSDNFYVVASGLWNLNQTPLSPYANPIIQIGFVGGF